MRALVALVLLLSGCASTAAWRTVDGVGVGAEVLLEADRQTARFGAVIDLPPDLVPLLVVLGHAPAG